METPVLQLNLPETHCLYDHPDDEDVYSPPLSGSVSIRAPSTIYSGEYPSIEISVIRVVTFGHRAPKSPSIRKASLLKRIARPAFLSSPCPATESMSEKRYEEPLVKLNLWPVPDRVVRGERDNTITSNFPFSIPLSSRIPETTTTTLGTVSYVVKATVVPGIGTPLHTTRDITILRRMVPGFCETINHVRCCKGSTMSLGLSLQPRESHDCSNRVSYSAKVTTRSSTAPGPREHEIRRVGVRELQWSVEETIKFLTFVNNTPVVHEQHVRQLSVGKLKGKWDALEISRRTPISDNPVEIDFDIAVPWTADATKSICIGSYDVQHLGPGSHDRQHDQGQRAAITIEHQVRLEVITGEDTIDVSTGQLVERKSLFESFSAYFPIIIHDRADEHMDRALATINDLPQYEEEFPKTPLYEEVCRT